MVFSTDNEIRPRCGMALLESVLDLESALDQGQTLVLSPTSLSNHSYLIINATLRVAQVASLFYLFSSLIYTRPLEGHIPSLQRNISY